MWWWILIWFVLICAAFAVLVSLGVRLFHKAVALTRQLGESAETFSALSQQFDALSRAFTPEPSAVFDDPAQLQRERDRDRRDRDRRRRARRHSTFR